MNFVSNMLVRKHWKKLDRYLENDKLMGMKVKVVHEIKGPSINTYRILPTEEN
jgi:hypothetical protein